MPGEVSGAVERAGRVDPVGPDLGTRQRPAGEPDQCEVFPQVADGARPERRGDPVDVLGVAALAHHVQVADRLQHHAPAEQQRGRVELAAAPADPGEREVLGDPAPVRGGGDQSRVPQQRHDLQFQAARVGPVVGVLERRELSAGGVEAGVPGDVRPRVHDLPQHPHPRVERRGPFQDRVELRR